MFRRVLMAIPALLLGLPAFALAADNRESGIVTLQVENDVVVGTDRNYTNGLRLSYLSPEVAPDHWSWKVARKLPIYAPGQKLRFSTAIGQSIFTPEDTEATQLILDDRPYAAWAYGGFGVLLYDDKRDAAGRPLGTGQMQSLVLELGVVGPWAMGEEVQNNFHTLIGAERSKGWSHQLENEPGAMLTYESKWRRFLFYGARQGLGLEVMPHVGGAVGNVMTYGALGASLRLGAGLPEDFGPPRIRPSLPGSGYFRGSDGFSWYLFAGAEGRYVLRNIFLDGNSYRDSHSIDKNPLVGDLQAGVAITYDGLRLSYTQVYRSPEIDGQSGDRFGSVALSLSLGF